MTFLKSEDLNVANVNEELWLEEIVRETEHYYQGEMRQEERASWLLATSSAILAILISYLLSNSGINVFVIKPIIIIPLGLFLFSDILAIIGVMPFSGTKGIRLFLRRFDTNPNDLIITKFRPGRNWDRESLKIRIFFHYRNHYVRNLQKSQLVIFSAIFLLIGLLSSILITIIFVLQ